MIGIIDYGAGNLFSLKCSLEYLGLESVIVSEAKAMDKCDRLILPGVGAFGDAVKKLRETSLDETILKEAQRGKPLLGICLGMQMLFCKNVTNTANTTAFLLSAARCDRSRRRRKA